MSGDQTKTPDPGSVQPVGSAMFVPDGNGLTVRSNEGKISVWRGKTKDEGKECIAVRMLHDSGNEHIFLLSPSGAEMLAGLLTVMAIKPNSIRSP
jgi:WD40 repeat protein